MITLDKLKERPLSYSSLKEFSKSPAHYVAYLNKKVEPTKEMLFGSLVHCMLLTPSIFLDKFAVMPNIDRRTTVGKQAYEDFTKQSEGKDVVTEQDYDDANNLVNKVISNQTIAEVIQNCDSFEKEWRYEINGLPVRGFYDGVAIDYILEVKTTSDAEPRAITADFFKRQYHMQAGMYNYVSGKPIKYIIIETKSPYNCYLADADDDFVSFGKMKIIESIDKFKECLDIGLFDMGYEFYGHLKIGLPGWIK